MRFNIQLRIADYLICKANDMGKGVELVKDIIDNTDCTMIELLDALKNLNNERDWQVSILDFKTIIYTISQRLSVSLLSPIINNRQTMEHSYNGESGRIGDNMRWARIVAKESMERVMGAINQGIRNKSFDFEDEYFLYDSEGEICYSWTTFEDFRKLNLLCWD